MWFCVDALEHYIHKILLPVSSLSCVYDNTVCSVLARWGFCEPIVLHLSVCLRRAVSRAISTNQSLRQTDAGRAVIRCCLTSTQYGTCVLSVGLIAGFGQAPTLHSSTGVRVVQLFCDCVRKTGSVGFFFFSFAHMWEHFWASWLWVSVSVDQSCVSLLYCCTGLSQRAWRSLSYFYGVLLSRSVAWACMDGCGPVGSLW